MPRVNLVWVAEQKEKAIAAKRESRVYEVKSSTLVVIRAVVSMLDDLGISFKILQLGAGVRKITTDTEVCSKCHGSGRC